jgi:nucleotide-binding universal stress UspA family protein
LRRFFQAFFEDIFQVQKHIYLAFVSRSNSYISINTGIVVQPASKCSERNRDMYDRILVALDGSELSRHAGKAAIVLAATMGSNVIACHIYGVDIHRRRFIDMEPGLPANYQQKETLGKLRTAHERLIREGFLALSVGYVDDFMNSARKAGVMAESVAFEGRSYTGILQLAKTRRCDLICLGADGLGSIGNGMLGGTTTRVLYGAPCDVLIARSEPKNRPILTGVDGSTEALKSVAKAVKLGAAMGKEVRMVAAYDPDFHTHVFGAVAESLSPERQKETGLMDQEKLHDDIINDGLGKLYTEFLNEAVQRFSNEDVYITTSLVTGKAYHALDAQAKDDDADLILISRHGHHREPSSRLGSNAEGLLRTASTNVLLVGGIDDKLSDSKSMSRIKELGRPESSLTWDSDAETRLQRVPSFVRSMAKRAVENSVRKSGKQRVSADDFDSVAAQFGMGRKKDEV